MAASNNKSEVIIDLNKILNWNDYWNDSMEVKRMQREFELHGWCFVILPTDLIPDSNLIDAISQFFKFNNQKSKYSQSPPIYGYSKVDHKEGIKLLTGSYFNQLANKGLVPWTLVQLLNYLSEVLDAVTKRLIQILDEHDVFQQQPSLSSLIKRTDLALRDEHFGIFLILTIKVVLNHRMMDKQFKKSTVYHIMIRDYFQLVYYQHMKDFN
jgi:hypothetical protein